MIKSQQSEEQSEGFFKPQEKVIKITQQPEELVQKNKYQQEGRELGDYERPSDFKARVINVFEELNHYPEYLMSDQCQQSEEEIGQRIVRQKIPQKYLTLQQKYLNQSSYKMVYSKLPANEFNNFIFNLNYLTDYSQKHYIVAESPSQVSEKNTENIEENSQKDVSYDSRFGFKFDSNFQCGNLLYVFQDLYQTQIPTFDLIIQNDTNTRGYNQWFYFSIQKLIQKSKTNNLIGQEQQQDSPKTIRIRIVNFIKKHLMFEDGVRPVAMFESSKEWNFIGREIQYKKSYIKRNIQLNGSTVTKNFYTLSFLLDFPSIQNQKVYIALNYPYPYKRVIKLINQLTSEPISQNISIQKQTLCHTISNNQVPYLVITSKPTQKQIQTAMKSQKTNKQKDQQKQQPQNKNQNFIDVSISDLTSSNPLQITQQQARQMILRKRKKILLFARQHPGQSVGSFVLEGFLRQLISGFGSANDALKNQNQEKLQNQITKQMKQIITKENHQKLLKQHSIYVFPMINVDGVIYGNFRTNLAGFDLNRQWIEPNKWLHPQIYHLKKLTSSLQNIHFVLDFHGHSRKLNSFIYACNNPVPILLQNQDQNNYPNISTFRLYPYIFSKQTDLFSIKDCTYTISRDKIKTARINTFKRLNFNPYIFTLQTGFYGYSKRDKKYRYKINDFYTIGKAALQSLKTILLKPKKTKQILKDVQNKSYLFDMWAFENKEDPGSESNPSEDELNPIQIRTKVLAQEKMKERQKRRNQIIKRAFSQNKKTQSKKQRKKRFHRKIQTELKSQKKLLQLENTNIQQTIVQKPQIYQSKVISRKQVKSQNQKIKGAKVEYYPERKRNLNSQLFNVVTMKQAVLQRPQFYLPLPNNKEKVNRVQKKVPHQEFKTTSNLLGNGLGNFHNKGYSLFESTVKSNPPTLQMLQINNLKRDVRIQSSVEASMYEDSKMRREDKFLERENQMKDLLFNINKMQDKSKFSRKSQGERIFVVRDNRIVRVVSNVNKEKSYNFIKDKGQNINNNRNGNKLKSQSSILQSQLSVKQNNLRKCQDKMSGDDKTLIEEIKEQRIDDKIRRKRVFLNPIQY